MSRYIYNPNDGELYHFGVKGMKWGVRRNRNTFGTVKGGGTSAPKLPYTVKGGPSTPKLPYTVKGISGKAPKPVGVLGNSKRGRSTPKPVGDVTTKKELTPEQKTAKRKKALKVGAAVVGTALAVYGAKKLNDYVRNKNTEILMRQGKERIDAYFAETRKNY